MLDLVVIGGVALVASGLTLFSGFGLGTILLPAFALFFPVPVAVAATAVVHMLNNIFKLVLIGRHVNAGVLLRFGLPAVLASFVGALALVSVADIAPIAHYTVAGREFEILPVKATIGVLIVIFSVLELIPAFARLAVAPRYLPLGGLLSGFFGGLSGSQGALRSAFLIKAGLDKNGFVATGTAAAVMVDLARLAVYGATFIAADVLTRGSGIAAPMAVAIVAAFAGAWVGVRILGSVTLRFLRIVVAVAMLLVGAGLAAGLV